MSQNFDWLFIPKKDNRCEINNNNNTPKGNTPLPISSQISYSVEQFYVENEDDMGKGSNISPENWNQVFNKIKKVSIILSFKNPSPIYSLSFEIMGAAFAEIEIEEYKGEQTEKKKEEYKIFLPKSTVSTIQELKNSSQFKTKTFHSHNFTSHLNAALIHRVKILFTQPFSHSSNFQLSKLKFNSSSSFSLPSTSYSSTPSPSLLSTNNFQPSTKDTKKDVMSISDDDSDGEIKIEEKKVEEKGKNQIISGASFNLFYNDDQVEDKKIVPKKDDEKFSLFASSKKRYRIEPSNNRGGENEDKSFINAPKRLKLDDDNDAGNRSPVSSKGSNNISKISSPPRTPPPSSRNNNNNNNINRNNNSDKKVERIEYRNINQIKNVQAQNRNGNVNNDTNNSNNNNSNNRNNSNNNSSNNSNSSNNNVKDIKASRLYVIPLFKDFVIGCDDVLPLADRSFIKRYIEGYGGRYVDDWTNDNSELTHLLTSRSSPWPSSFNDNISSITSNDFVIVEPKWVFDCHNNQKILPEHSYLCIDF